MMTLMRALVVFAALLLLAGCSMTWRANWPAVADNRPTPASRELMGRAEATYAVAGDEEGVRRAIVDYQRVLGENPGDVRALTQLSTLHILLGAAYTSGRQAQSAAFHTAMDYAERAMYTNPEFRAAVVGGLPPWEAASTLTAAEVEAMFFWVTAVQYDFKDGMYLAEKIVNVGWLRYCQQFLDRIDAVAPGFGGGGVEFARVICDYALPKGMGGDKARGDEYMHRALVKGAEQGWLMPRWGRGKYYFEILGEKELQRQDLEWVAGQDPAQMHDPYPWLVYFQRNARELLKED